MTIPQTFIQDLLNRVDVVDVIGRYVHLKKGGANFIGLCPFHGEKSPSFNVSPSKQFYHCFGCGVNGNAIGFLMEHAGLSFIEAVKDLAQQTGMQIPEDDASPQDRERAAQAKQKQATLNTVLDKAAHAYIQQLKITPRAVTYLKGRGLSGEVAKTFGLGYAPEGWRALAGIFSDYADPLLVESGLVIEHAGEVDADGETKRYDRFRDRIMFPIRNVKGECIGFGGRVLDKGEPKYLNSPETPVFSKGRELYGLYEARTPIRVAGYALITEGYMDVVALAQLGFANAVATLGTACTPDHMQKLFRFTDAVVFSFDGDGAGRRAARKALDATLPLATDTRNVKFLFLPPEHDPDSFIRANGSDAFATAVKEAVPLSIFLIDAASSECDLSSAEGRARMTSQARPLWNALPDGALKRQLIGDLAESCGLSSQDLLQIWQQSHDAAQWRRTPQQETTITNARYHENPTSFYEQPTTTLSAPQEGEGYVGGAEYTAGFFPKRFDKGGYSGKNHGSKWRKDPPQPRMLGQRKAGSTRADRAVGLLLTHPHAWQRLSADDHAMLAQLPGMPGQVFSWLEAQMNEHGPQPWAALREALRGLAHEAFACAQAEQLVSTDDSDDPQGEEIREVMTRLRIERLKVQESEAIALVTNDPNQLLRYRELQAERKALEHKIDQ